MKRIVSIAVCFAVLVMCCATLIGCIGDGRSFDGKEYDPFNDRWSPLYKFNPLRELDPLRDISPWGGDD